MISYRNTTSYKATSVKKWFLSTYILLIFICSGVCQELAVEIRITTDDFPQDISWEIVGPFSETVRSESLRDCGAFTTCSFNVQLDSRFCHSFIIRDRFGDGIENGRYLVYVDGSLVVDSVLGGESAQHDINCGRGESCSEAIQLNLPIPPFEKIKAPKNKDYWFTLTPEEFGLYRITTCVNLISGQGYPDTKLWIYETCDRDIIREGAEGAIAFSDDFIQCEPASAFHYFPLDEGVDYYIRVRRDNDPVDLDSIEVKFIKLPSIHGCTDPLSCNYNPYANIDNGDCVYGDCAPDLSLDEVELQNSVVVDTIFSNDECLVAEGCLKGPGDREVIRFTTKIDNIGNTDYILGSPEADIANFSNNNCHGHWHQDGYAEYLLFDGSGVPEPIGFKTGFCVLDLDCEGKIPKYICSYMGITAGCSDIYSSEIECQWIDITDVEDGIYTLVVRVNWNRFSDIRGFSEATFDNNWGQVCFKLDRSSGQTILEQLDSCPEYQDCRGFTYGQTTMDCEGVCGGTAHFGDLDGSGELTMDDIFPYMSMLENGNTSASVCFDLDDSGDLSIYDAVLAYECADATLNIQSTPFHNHCTFPGGFLNEQNSVTLRMANHDEENRTFEIEILGNQDDLTGLQIELDGMVIESVEKMYDDVADYLVSSTRNIYILHGSSKLQRSNDYKKLVKVKYNDADNICISENSIVIDAAYNRVRTIVTENCISTSTQEITDNNLGIQIYPNPTQDYLFVNADQIDLEAIQIFDAKGNRVFNQSNINQSLSLNVSQLVEGVYFIKLTSNNGKQYSKKIIKY